jgi:Flp pilus assembly pilin Flp
MMKNQARLFLYDNQGTTAIEYALLCAMIAMVIVLSNIGQTLSGYFAEISSALK